MRKLFLAQIILTLLLAFGWGVVNAKVIPSVLYGGLACLLPNIYFAYRFFSQKHTRRPGKILLAFYLGEFFKMIVSSALIILAIKYADAIIIPTVLGYFVANLAFWMAPMLVLKRQAQQTQQMRSV